MEEAGGAGDPVKKPQQLWGAGSGVVVALVSQTGDMPVDHDPTCPMRKRRISQVRQLPKFISFSHLPELPLQAPTQRALLNAPYTPVLSV